MKHRKPSRIKASTSLPLATAVVAVSLLATPANAAPADPGAVPAAPEQQPGATDDNPAPEQAGSTGNGKPEQVKPQPSQPGVTTPGSPKPDTTQPAGEDPAVPEEEQVQPAGVGPDAKPSQPGVSVPRVAPLPVPGQTVPGQTTPGEAVPAVETENKPQQPGTTQPSVPKPEATTPGATVDDQTKPEEPDTVINTLTDDQTVETQPRWQAPAIETAPAAPVVEMTGPHTEIGASLDGGTLLPGVAANTHHFSNLDGYVGTIGYTTPGGIGEAGMALDFTTVNQIKVTAYTRVGEGDDRQLEFVLDTAVVNAVKADTENFIRLLPGGATILEAAAQIGRLPAGEHPAQTVDLGGVTTQVGGSVQY
ncbi:hypothetical protein [Nocardia sp. IFM 10818]